jgi:hypothetical protein
VSVNASTTSSSVAAIVLAHNEPAQIRRLLRVLDPLTVFLHCDLSTPASELAAMLEGASERVTTLERRAAWRGGWSLVNIELHALKAALEQTEADYIVLMSGACYPLLSAEALEAELASTPGQSRLNHWRLPYAPWGSRLGADGGLWRLKFRFLARAGRPVKLGGRPIPIGPARVPAGLELYGGSHFKVYARAHAQQLLTVLGSQPELIRFFRTSFIPEESFAQSILKSPELVGETAEQILPAEPWYLEFPQSREEGQDAHGHGDWLDPEAFAAIEAAGAPAGPGHPHLERALFARKFRSASTELLDRIDRELHTRTDPGGAA